MPEISRFYGIIKLVDLESYLKGKIFEPLKNIDHFKTVKVSKNIDTIAWKNGADISPDFLYEMGEEISSESVNKVALYNK